MFLEIAEFIIYTTIIVLISKNILVKTLRKLAENLSLKAKTVGDIAGYATSIPELLTVSISSINGFIDASIFNILSSNIINFIQYISSIIVNKNKKTLKNQAIKVDIILVIITIIIPLALIWKNIKMNFSLVPFFIISYILFMYLDNNAHKLYLKKEDKEMEKRITQEGEQEIGNTRKTAIYIFILIGAGILLYIVGELLGNTLDNLCNKFNISQTIIGILLGFITSIPELITFFESQKYHKSQENEEILGVVEATNNLLTSNISNLFIIQTIGIIIYNIL